MSSKHQDHIEGYHTSTINTLDSQRSTKTTSYGRNRMSTGQSKSVMQPAPPTSIRTGTASGRPTSRMGTGYSKKSSSSGSDPYGQQKNQQLSEEELAEAKRKELENTINNLLDESYLARSAKDYTAALEKAKQAEKKEKLLRKSSNGGSGTGSISTLSDSSENPDLTYCVLFNLADCYHMNKMHDEALTVYHALIKSKMYSNAVRLRINMGNIYMELKQFNFALKMYRMAYEQMAPGHEYIKNKVMSNIVVAYLKMGQYHDSLLSVDMIQNPSEDLLFNMVLCSYLLGDISKMKSSFKRMVTIDIPPAIDDEIEDGIDNSKPDSLLLDLSPAGLSLKRRRKITHYISVVSRILAPEIEESVEDGFNWLIQTIKDSPCYELVAEIELAKAIFYLKEFDMDRAERILLNFKVVYPERFSTAALNLAVIKEANGNFKEAESFANACLNESRSNVRALIVLGNCSLHKDNIEQAVQFYKEAYENDNTSHEVLYNLGLSYKMNGDFIEALDIFKKLHQILQIEPETIYQLADVNDRIGDSKASLEWFNTLLSLTPNDPEVLIRMGKVCDNMNDISQAIHFYTEALRFNPTDIQVLQRLGTHFVESDMYDKAIEFFSRAACVQPNEAKWRLMTANCLRRTGNHQNALQLYKNIHENFPENQECLRFLSRLCYDMGLPEAQDYAGKLTALQHKTRIAEASQSIAGMQLNSTHDQLATEIQNDNTDHAQTETTQTGSVKPQEKKSVLEGMRFEKDMLTALPDQ